MSTLTAAALIATTATIVPTPLGGDNVVAARVLGFENVVDYVAFHLAPITIPALFVMGIVHYFWQTYLDKKDAVLLKELDKETVIEAERPEKNTPTWYFIFPILPLVLVIFFWVFFRKAKVGLVEITLFSLVLAFVCELFRKRNVKDGMKDLGIFFKGMGDGFSKVVVLIVAASSMVFGLRVMGLIDAISNSISNFENAKVGLMLAFSGITGLITSISGCGNAVFYSFIELIQQIEQKAGIDLIRSWSMYVQPVPLHVSCCRCDHHRLGIREGQSSGSRQTYLGSSDERSLGRFGAFVLQIHVRSQRCRQETVCTKLVKV